MARSISSMCPDRESAYEIQSELMVRKFLETGTNHRFEFRKNDDKTGVDLICLAYDIFGAEWQRRQIGTVEIELSEQWKNEYPKYWKYYSFLARKLFCFDWNVKRFDFEKPRDECKDMIYVVSNKALTDWIAIDASRIMEQRFFWQPQRERMTGKEYNDWFIRFPIGSFCVRRGKDDVLALVKDFFEQR